MIARLAQKTGTKTIGGRRPKRVPPMGAARCRYGHLPAAGKRKKVALVACVRSLLTMLYAMANRRLVVGSDP